MDKKRGNSKYYVSYMRKCYSLIRRQSRLSRLGRSSRAAWIEKDSGLRRSGFRPGLRIGRLSGIWIPLRGSDPQPL